MQASCYRFCCCFGDKYAVEQRLQSANCGSLFTETTDALVITKFTRFGAKRLFLTMVTCRFKTFRFMPYKKAFIHNKDSAPDSVVTRVSACRLAWSSPPCDHERMSPLFSHSWRKLVVALCNTVTRLIRVVTEHV